jgi:GrpB-like predicted nucleotidyltransferase (UPF0157 family)
MIEICDYDPQWAVTFEELRRLYAAALADVPYVSIEHVGSTSVVGLPAKPVIDIDIVVLREHVVSASTALASIGFLPRGQMGIDDRWAFVAPPNLPRTHTYIAVDKSLALRNHLAVRNVLRTDGALRDEYARLKQRLAQETDDMDVYVEGKSDLLAKMLRRGGLTEHEIELVFQANRNPHAPKD